MVQNMWNSCSARPDGHIVKHIIQYSSIIHGKTKNTPLCYAHYKLCALFFVYWIIRLVFVSYNFEMKALLTKERLSKLREWDLKSLILTIYRIVVYKGPLLTYISVQKQEVFKRLTHHYQEKPGFLYIYLDTWSFK